MPVSGLLLTIDRTHEGALREALAADPRTLAGDLVGPRLVVVLETADRTADEAAWDWLRQLPGVRWVDLAWITIDPRDEPACPGPGRRPDPTARQGAHP